MRSYTDIEQSKRLAEILPIESADMRYHTISQYNLYPCDEIVYTIDFSKPSGIDIPCWSLAALLSVLPKNLNIGRPSLDSNYMGYYWIQYYDEFMKPNNYKTECFNNPIDACYEMIIKLNELKML